MVTAVEDAARWRAPEPLEDVRRFLNTWEYVTRTGETRDHLPQLAQDAGKWRRRFSRLGHPKRSDLHDLVALRAGLRDAVERELDPQWLNDQLRSAGIAVAVARDAGGDAEVEFVPRDVRTPTADVLTIVLEAIRDGTWQRLKACPDCRLVFFDHSRNGSKRWCQMSARDGGRACGSIAKVRRWRAQKGGDAS